MILCIDDDEILLKAISRLLGRDRTITAAREVDGLDLAERHQPEVILLDVRLGESDGLDLLPLLRARSPKSRVIVFTAHYTIDGRKAALSAGATGYLDKMQIYTLKDEIHEIIKDCDSGAINVALPIH